VTSWRSLAPSSILARSGERFVLSGLGFRPAGAGYSCVLLHAGLQEHAGLPQEHAGIPQEHAGGNTSVPATALSATAMECTFPLWDRAAASAPLVLLDGATAIVFAGTGALLTTYWSEST